jgi:hypothetical protein
MASPANSVSAAAYADDVPFSGMASSANSVSAAADVDDVPFSGTCLVFTICIVDTLKVDGVTNRFVSFVNEEGETIDQEFGSVTIARGVQGDNPYATITENRSVILKQRKTVRFLLRELNAVYLHPTTAPITANYLMNILLADEIDEFDYDHDDDDNDDDNVDDVDDLGRLHSVTILSARFDNDDDNDGDE